MTDIRDMSYVQITDTYNRKTGEHLRSVCTSPAGETIWDDGPTPSKNVAFLPVDFRKCWDIIYEADQN